MYYTWHMSDQVNARPWKIATFVLAAACAGLVVLLLVRSGATIDAGQAAGKITKKSPEKSSSTIQPVKPAPVSLRKFTGPDTLMPNTKTTMEKRLKAAGSLTYEAAGVTGLSVDTMVVDQTKQSGDKMDVDVTVKLLVLKQPGNNLLSAISASAAASVDKSTPKDVLLNTKLAVLEYAAEASFDDLISLVNTPPESDTDDE